MSNASDQFYLDMGIDPAAVREFNTTRATEAQEVGRERDRLRIEYKARHHNGCPAYKSLRIPFESCGTCLGAFNARCERIKP